MWSAIPRPSVWVSNFSPPGLWLRGSNFKPLEDSGIYINKDFSSLLYIYIYVYIYIWIYFICILYNHICQLWRWVWVPSMRVPLTLHHLTGPYESTDGRQDNSCNMCFSYVPFWMRPFYDFEFDAFIKGTCFFLLQFSKHINAVTLVCILSNTLPETNIVYENQWLEDEICIWDGLFTRARSLRECFWRLGLGMQLRPEEQDAYLEAQDTENLFGSLVWLIGWLIHSLIDSYVQKTSTDKETDKQTDKQANKPKQSKTKDRQTNKITVPCLHPTPLLAMRMAMTKVHHRAYYLHMNLYMCICTKEVTCHTALCESHGEYAQTSLC